MKPTILTSDWQVSFGNLDRCETMLSELLSWIKAKDVGAVIHLGDVKEQFSPVDMRALDFCVDAVKAIVAQCPMYILKGNHDMHGTTDAANDFLYMLGLAGATVITKPETCLVSGVEWAFLPWSYSIERQRKWADALKRIGAPYLAFHAEVRGSMLNYTKKATEGLSRADLGASKYRGCYGGHLHRWQEIDNVTYVGSPFAMDWNDANSRKGHVLFSPGISKRLLTKIPGYHDPSLKGFKEPKHWEGAHVRVHVACDRAKDDVHAKLHLEGKRAQGLYLGAHVKTVPYFEDKPIPEVEEDSDSDALKRYLEQTYPTDKELPSLEAALKVLSGYLGGDNHGRSKGKVQFLQAKAGNFLSFEELELTFTDGVTLVRGVNLDWNGKSNGAGKTCLLQMIAVALFGTTFKRQKADRWTRRGSTDRAWVAVKMKLQDGRECIVQRSRRPNKLQLFIDGKNVSVGRGVAGVQADIEELTGLTMQTLANAVYIDQGTISEFLYGTDATRYKLLERFMNLERFEVALQAVKEAVKGVNASKESVYRDWLVRKDRIKTAEQELKRASEGEGDVDSTTASYEAVNAEFIKVSAQAQVKIEELSDKVEADSDKIEKLSARANIKLGKKAALRQQIVDLEESIHELDGKTCPVCKQQITTGAVAKHRAEVRKRIIGYADEVDDITLKTTEARAVRDKIQRRMEQGIRKRVDWEQQVKHADQELVAARRDMRQAEWKRDNLSKHATGIEQLRKEVRNSDVVLADYEAELKLLRYCSTVFHRDGLPGFVGKLFYPRLNHAAMHYSEMFTGGQIQVQFVETDEGIRPEIINVSGGETLEDQSEGERRLASIVTSFALRDAADPCNVLILDEPGMGLDRGNAADFAKALRTNQDRFGCVLLVTHNEHIEAALDGVRTLVVTKQDKVSRL